jgi:hypothetical protein
MPIRIRSGQRKKLRLRLMIDGPAKSGKSFTSLRFAYALAPTGRVLVIEAGERGSTEKYYGEGIDGKKWEFDICQLDDYSPENYTEAIREAGRQGYESAVIDSLSHEWVGKGGALEIANQKTGPFGDWKTATPLHDAMFEEILSSPCHVIATIRSKMDYVLQTNDKGKLEPIKVGMAPIQRDTVPYEFDILLSMDQAHVGTVSGSRCRAIEGASVLKPGADFLKPVILWLETGVKLEAPKPSPRITDPQIDRVAELLGELRWMLDRIAKDFPRKYGVTELTKLTHEQASGLIKWLEAAGGRPGEAGAGAAPGATAACRPAAGCPTSRAADRRQRPRDRTDGHAGCERTRPSTAGQGHARTTAATRRAARRGVRPHGHRRAPGFNESQVAGNPQEAKRRERPRPYHRGGRRADSQPRGKGRAAAHPAPPRERDGGGCGRTVLTGALARRHAATQTCGQAGLPSRSVLLVSMSCGRQGLPPLATHQSGQLQARKFLGYLAS